MIEALKNDEVILALATIFEQRIEEAIIPLKKSIKSYQNDIKNLKAELNETKQEICQLKQKSVVWPAIKEKGGSPLLAAVHTEMSEIHRRSKNIVIVGLAPSDSLNDADIFTDLCEQHLSVKPIVHKEKCKRLGTATPGKIQHLLISLDSDVMAKELIKSSRQLYHSADDAIKKIFINPHLTLSESKAAFEARQLRKQIREKNRKDDGSK